MNVAVIERADFVVGASALVLLSEHFFEAGMIFWAAHAFGQELVRILNGFIVRVLGASCGQNNFQFTAFVGWLEVVDRLVVSSNEKLNPFKVIYQLKYSEETKVNLQSTNGGHQTAVLIKSPALGG